MTHRKHQPVIVLIVVFTLFPSLALASPAPPVGQAPGGILPLSTTSQSLFQVVNEFGQITLSTDAVGTLSNTGTVQVDKPAGATVRKAFLLAATTGFMNWRLITGDVKLQGNSVVWEREIASSISSYNYWADVTSIVKQHVDSAPAGTIDLEIYEANTSMIDGEILAVIFDDPNQTVDNTVLLYFGAQNINGDSFTIDFGEPIDKDDPDFNLEYTLGISFGYQEYGIKQYSIVDVNNRRLTTSAGGDDDGEPANGALITVGGLGDTPDNPSEPYAEPVDRDSDDELYDLAPFVNDGETSIKIDTSNPSQDDNILFAGVIMGATRGVVGIDIDVSLHNNPSTAEARAPYESIIRYFADGVYESSNGAHKLGTVTFHTSGAHTDDADVVWIDECHPSASVAGFGTNGFHVNMCDVFENGSGSGNDYDFLEDDAHQKGGGYTLAHEWGHYYYSLYDEYVGDPSYDSIFHFPHSTDKPVSNSIMNSQWNATGGSNNWLNFSVAKNDTQQTAQFRVYGACGWDTLARPVSDDPRDGERESLPTRLYHPELKQVAPAANEDSAIELPGTARSALKIVWQSSTAASSSSTGRASMSFAAQLHSILGQNISYPNPILLLAFVHKDLTLADVGVNGSVQLPDGSFQTVAFADDGVPPDALEGDGLYSAILGYEANGVYNFEVQFDNDAGTATFVSTAFQPSLGVNGQPIPLSPPVLVNEPFTISETLQVVVSNVVPDDYGNTSQEAHAITADNVPVPGRIDYAGDRDVFQFSTRDDRLTYVRVTNLALAMNPHLRVLGPDGTTVLFEEDLDPLQDEYLVIALHGLAPATTVYAEVSDISSQAPGGLYDISAGRSLASDQVQQILMFLPYIAR